MSFDAISWQTLQDFFIVICVSLSLLALAGLPVMALTGEVLAKIRQRSSYDKCARQLSVVAVILGWILAIAGGVYVWFMLDKLTFSDLQSFEVTAKALTVQGQGIALAWLSLMCGVFLLSLYVALWRNLRSYPLIHQLFVLLGCLLCYEAIYGLMSVIAADTACAQGEVRPLTLTELFMPPAYSPLWNIIGYFFPLTLSMAGAVGALWLMLRRNRDDYGRDHYMQMVPWCATWARNGWIVLWMLMLGFTALHMWDTRPELQYIPMAQWRDAGLQLLLWLIPALLWTIVCRSANPLRHKLTLVLALALSLFLILSLYFELAGSF